LFNPHSPAFDERGHLCAYKDVAIELTKIANSLLRDCGVRAFHDAVVCAPTDANLKPTLGQPCLFLLSLDPLRSTDGDDRHASSRYE
jgi:hypothetical protein